jgi:hypothetical protein
MTYQNIRSKEMKTKEEAVSIIITSALDFLAEKHNVSFEVIVEHLAKGNINLKNQLEILLAKGMEAVKKVGIA